MRHFVCDAVAFVVSGFIAVTSTIGSPSSTTTSPLPTRPYTLPDENTRRGSCLFSQGHFPFLDLTPTLGAFCVFWARALQHTRLL